MAEWGYTHRRLETELTDELFVLYLDAANDRVSESFMSDVDAVRAGTIFSHDQKQYDKWRARSKPRTRGLVGDALEAAVMGIAAQFPDNVVRGTL